MPASLLNLLPLVKKHWKPIAIILLLAVTFGTGWKVNGWRWETRMESERADRQEAITKAVLTREAELRTAWLRDMRAAEAVATALEIDLAEIRARNSALSAEIATRTLSKPADVTCTNNETGEISETQPNPFSQSFVDLWNAAGRLHDD